MPQKASARTSAKKTVSKTAPNKLSVNKVNPTLVIIIVIIMALVGYLLVRLSFAAGSNVTSKSSNKAGKPKPYVDPNSPCSYITTYTYLSRYNAYCENGTTVNKRPDKN